MAPPDPPLVAPRGQAGRLRARAAGSFAIVAAAVVFVAACTRLAHVIVAVVNSDALYLAAMYRDLFVDKVSLAGWSTQPAPSFFPDLPVYFVIRALTGNAVVAIVVYALLAAIATVALMVRLLRLVGVASWWSPWCASFVSVATVVYLSSLGELGSYLLLPGDHGASLLVGLLVTLLIGEQVAREKPDLARLVAIAVLSALTATSDRIYIVWFAGPLVATLAVCVLQRVVRLRVAAFVVSSIGVGLLGERWLETVPARFGINVATSIPHVDVSWKNFVAKLGMMPPPETDLTLLQLTLALLAFSVASALVLYGVVRRPRGRDRRSAAARCLAFVSLLYVFVVACTFGGALCTGAYWNPWCARYLIPLFVLPYLFVGATLVVHEGRALKAALVALVLLGTWLSHPMPGLVKKMERSAGLPAAIACVDRIATLEHARYGYGDYWSARKTTEESRVGLHIVPLKDGLTVWTWINNLAWYARVPSDVDAFLVLPRGLSADAIQRRWGAPRRTETCGDTVVNVYAGPIANRPMP